VRADLAYVLASGCFWGPLRAYDGAVLLHISPSACGAGCDVEQRTVELK